MRWQGDGEFGAQLGVQAMTGALGFTGWCLIVLMMRVERARGQWGIINCAATLPVC